jgi:hypothetical protein
MAIGPYRFRFPGEDHRTELFQGEFRRLLTKNGIEFDERCI